MENTHETVKTMNSETLITLVRAAEAEDWKNSDLWSESEQILGQIADHLAVCPACRETFDAQAYPETTLVEFEPRIATNPALENWICDGPAVDLSSLDEDDPLALLEVDSRGAARYIYLVFEWEENRITVETRNPSIDGIPELRYRGRESAYFLPTLVDAAELRDWVEEEVLPLARPLFAAYERVFENGGWVGSFPSHGQEFEDFEAWMDSGAQPPLLQGESAGIWSANEWLVDVPDGLTAETTDADLLVVASGIVAEARADQVVLNEDEVRLYLAGMRAAL